MTDQSAGESASAALAVSPRRRALAEFWHYYSMNTGAVIGLAVFSALQRLDQSLIEASRDLGASEAQTFFRVTLPVIAPGVISGALFAFATSFDEVVVTLFLAGPDQVTLPRQMFTGIRENITPTIAAVATLLILFTTGLLLALEWLRGRRR